MSTHRTAAARRITGLAGATLALVFTAACGRGGGDADTAGATSAAGATTSVVTGDTGAMAGMQHDSAGMPSRPPAKDADHEFLRRMSDHHQGLIQIAMEAMNKATASSAKSDAHNLHTKQEAEMKKMVDTVRAAYGEQLAPMTMPQHKAMHDSLQQKTGAEYDRTFYRMVAQHHREGIQMMDQYEPRVQRASTKEMITKMRAEHQKEIQELERKAGQG